MSAGSDRPFGQENKENKKLKRKVPDLGEIGHDRGIKFSVEELNNSYGDIIAQDQVQFKSHNIYPM